jgi:hypothetical protein
LVYANLGYYWYPKVEVSIYNEVPEEDGAPITYAYIENESKAPLYYAVYRKVSVGDNSYLIKVSNPYAITTRKTVKVYLPEDASKEKEYVVVPRRDETDLLDAMDDKGKEVSDDMLEQIRDENEDLEPSHEIKIDDIDRSERKDLQETKASARKNEEEIRSTLENLDKEDKSKLPIEKELPAVKEDIEADPVK